jgi:hypothetical protein
MNIENASTIHMTTVIRMHEAWLQHNKPTHPQYRNYENGLKLHREEMARRASVRETAP